MNLDALTERKLEFDTAAFLQSLFAHDIHNLKELETRLHLSVVSRDGWIQFKGSAENVQIAEKLFSDLETTKRAGTEISSRDFLLALDLARAASQIGVSDIAHVRLLGTKGNKPVRPRTLQQMNYVKAMQKHDVVFGIGPAGTGKTYLAMAMALTMLQKGEISRIILTRPAVEAGEALGFLPGDLKEKVAPYLRPLYDAMHDMLTPEETQRYLDLGIIEIAPLAFMRGRTLSNAFVILDESQNTTCEQMLMTLTRLGEHSRMVITGDPTQIDLKRGVKSGLIEAERALRHVEEIAIIQFNQSDIVRHPLVARIVSAYEKIRAVHAEMPQEVPQSSSMR